MYPSNIKISNQRGRENTHNSFTNLCSKNIWEHWSRTLDELSLIINLMFKKRKNFITYQKKRHECLHCSLEDITFHMWNSFSRQERLIEKRWDESCSLIFPSFSFLWWAEIKHKNRSAFWNQIDYKNCLCEASISTELNKIYDRRILIIHLTSYLDSIVTNSWVSNLKIWCNE